MDVLQVSLTTLFSLARSFVIVTTKYLLSHRCPADNTLQFHPGEIHHKKFSFLAFNFRTNVPVIYLHCQVFLCHRSSQDSRCHSGCTSINKVPSQRKKRSIEKREITEGTSKNYFLDNGPIVPKNAPKNKGMFLFIFA